MTTHTEMDRLCVNRWRGMPDNLLLELNGLDQLALDQGLRRFRETRVANIADRLRCIELRKTHDLHLLQKLPRVLSP